MVPILRPAPHGPQSLNPKGPKYLYGTKYGFCSSNFPYGLGKYTPYGYLGPFGEVCRASLDCHVNLRERALSEAPSQALMAALKLITSGTWREEDNASNNLTA